MTLHELIESYFLLQRMGGELLSSQFDTTLVTLSYLVATFASYTALNMVSHMRSEYAEHAQLNRYWWLGASIALGGGIFAMHFVGMLAFSIPLSIRYDFGITLLSLLVAVSASAIALYTQREQKTTETTRIKGALILGMGIAMMHYIGMEALLAEATLRYSPGLWMLSIIIAVAVSYAALRLLHHSTAPQRTALPSTLLVAIIMGAAVSGMHYTGMAAAQFYSGGSCGLSTGIFNIELGQFQLGVSISIVAILIFAVGLIASIFSERLNHMLHIRNQDLEKLVTERTAILNQRNLELEQSKERFQRLVEDMGEGFMVYSINPESQHIEYLSKEFERIFGIQTKQMIGQSWSSQIQWQPESIKHGMKIHQDTMEKGHARGGVLSFHHATSGELRHAMFSQHMARDKSGAPKVINGVAVDITDRKRLEEMLSEQRNTLIKTMKAKDDFLATVSHELRTPLASIIGNSEILSARLNDREDLRMIRSIELSGRRELALVNDILDISKIQSGNLMVDESPYDLTVILSHVNEFFTTQAKENGLEFTVTQKGSERFLLVGDEQRISQILHNLLGNAIKFTSEGKITLTVWSDPHQLYFVVEDTGIGIPADKLDHLFDYFHQVDSSITRRFGGAGLGLFVSSSLAKLMGGTIEATSIEGEGSRFTLTLPHRESRQLVSQQKPVSERDSAPYQGRMLVVEDTPVMQLLIRKLLEKLGLDVEVANDGKEGVEKATKHHFDLILMDMQMPVMDGIEATKTLRDSGNDVPIVALTANITKEYRDQFDEAGANGFLGKPINTSQLKRILTQFMTKHGVEEEEPQQAVDQSVATSVSVVDESLKQIFIERVHELKLTLSAALTIEDWNEVRDIAHVMKGSGTSFGYPELTQTGTEICDAYDHGRLDKLPTLTMNLIFESSKVL